MVQTGFPPIPPPPEHADEIKRLRSDRDAWRAMYGVACTREKIHISQIERRQASLKIATDGLDRVTNTHGHWEAKSFALLALNGLADLASGKGDDT